MGKWLTGSMKNILGARKMPIAGGGFIAIYL
jgi:hypothetical protein